MGQRLAAVFACVMTVVVPVLGGEGKASTDSLSIALEILSSPECAHDR